MRFVPPAVERQREIAQRILPLLFVEASDDLPGLAGDEEGDELGGGGGGRLGLVLADAVCARLSEVGGVGEESAVSGGGDAVEGGRAESSSAQGLEELVGEESRAREEQQEVSSRVRCSEVEGYGEVLGADRGAGNGRPGGLEQRSAGAASCGGEGGAPELQSTRTHPLQELGSRKHEELADTALKCPVAAVPLFLRVPVRPCYFLLARSLLLLLPLPLDLLFSRFDVATRDRKQPHSGV
eukprot:466440-Hanusia_phi.AAC.2